MSAWESMKWRIPIGYDSLYFHAKDNSWLPLSSRLLCHSLMTARILPFFIQVASTQKSEQLWAEALNGQQQCP